MMGVKRKTFWTILVGVNITSTMICTFSRNFTGAGFCMISLIACYYMLSLCERDQN